jgi:hypothetical protein
VRFKPALETKEIPGLMAHVAHIAPFGWWKRRLRALSDQENKNALFRDYFDREFGLERTYGRVHEYHRTTGRYPDINAQNYELFSFLGSLALVHQRLSAKGKGRIQSNIRGALLAGGLEPIAAELRTAVHLMQQKYDVQFLDLEGIEQFDLLAANENLEIEVDCKAVSGDVRRKIHGGRFRALAGQLMPTLGRIVDDGHNYLVKVTIPGSLHGDRTYERQLITQIDLAIKGLKPSASSGPLGDISIEEFERADSPFGQQASLSNIDLAEFLSRKFALENVNAAARWLPGRGAVVFVVQSASADKVVDGIYRQLKSSAQTQFSKRRPAMLCVQLRDFDAAQLRDLANSSPNGLAIIATKLFSGTQRLHLAGVSFLANEGALTQRRFEFGNLRRTSYQDVGAAYVFANPEHPAAAAVGAAFRGRGAPA